MSIFNIFKKNELNSPVLHKQKRSLQLEKLNALLNQKLPKETKEKIEQEIYQVKSGDIGEKQVLTVLKNSHMPMYILHDLYLKEGGLHSQIDFLVIARKLIFVIECKNYSNHVYVNAKGRFSILKKDNSQMLIDDPVEQNRRHMELVALLKPDMKKRLRSVVVFTNPYMKVHDEKAPAEISRQLMTADRLLEFFRKQQADSRLSELSDEEMKQCADFFKEKHTKNPVDYTEKYFQTEKPAEEKKAVPVKPVLPRTAVQKPVVVNHAPPKQKLPGMRCPKCRKSLQKSSDGMFYCPGECGMKLGQVFDHKLTETELRNLLGGKTIQCSTQAGMTLVLPDKIQKEWKGKTVYEWKTKLLSKK